MPEIRYLLFAIPALPLAAAVVTAGLGKKILRAQSHWPTVLALVLSCAASLMLAGRVWQVSANRTAAQSLGPGYEQIVTLWTWTATDEVNAEPRPMPDQSSIAVVQTGTFHISVSLRADPLTAIMLATVTLVALLVAVYSIGYMRDDPGYWRFFSYISLFVFSMTMLVSVSNFILLYVFWEAVGLCSYLLIGFWFQRPAAAAAGTKAFLVNRVGDCGFLIALFLLWIAYRTFDFHDTIIDGRLQTAGILGQHLLAHPQWYVGGGMGLAICLLLMAGACGKSAQFPLHIWLPDAMEGPTPVSALIHAATMVTAGVYMVARCMPLFMASVPAQYVVATIGGLTALLAALIALTQNDLKRILAYSTISQLGYMFLALGTATLLGATAGMFHLFTHAFFKALLFLGAGSVLHAMGGVVDLRAIGGLRRRMPITHATFLIGCLALAGIWPFSGFYSKDMILAAAYQHAVRGPSTLYWWLYLAALVTAGITAFYAFRAFFLTFYGDERVPAEAGHHAHESPPVMTFPLILLAIAAAVVGAYFQATGSFAELLSRTPSLAYSGMALTAGHVEEAVHHHVALLSTAVAVGGLLLAVALYLGPPMLLQQATSLAKATGLYQLSYRRFFIDEIYEWLLVVPLRVSAWLLAWLDRLLVDGVVDFMGWIPQLLGTMLRPLQNGLVQFYALAMVLGLLVLIAAFLI